MIMTDSVRTANATTPSRRSRLQPRVLEPRVLLDAAAVETAVAVAADASAEPALVVDTSALFDAPATTGRREAYVVDTSVEGYEGLLSAVPEGAELFLIDGSKSGLAQLNEALDSVDGQFDAIHVISHGAGGALKLGADTITASNVGEFQAALNSLGAISQRMGICCCMDATSPVIPKVRSCLIPWPPLPALMWLHRRILPVG
jgi:hypothetical protein